MGNKIRRFNTTVFYDYEGIARHLEKMAEKGYFIEKANNIIWTYRKDEPKKVKYYVTYFPEASDFNPYQTDNQENFLSYCKSLGWHLAAEFAQMQILYSEEEDPAPLETDDVLKLKSINKSLYLQAGILHP